MNLRNSPYWISLAAIIIFCLISCQEDPGVPGNGDATPEPLTTKPRSTRIPSEEASAPTREVPAPEQGTVTPQFESTQVITSEVPLAEQSNVCGILLPVVGEVGDAEVLELPAVSIPIEDVPLEAQPALLRLISAPETVGLVAFEIGRESEGLYINDQVPMPLASVVKIINLIAYAQAVDDGRLDPGSWIPLEEINKYYLPRVDLGAHDRALDELESQTLIAGEPASTPLEEIPGMMIRHSSNAAADYIHMAVGQEALEATALEIGIESQTAPCPWIGQFLVLANHQREGSHKQAVEEYIENPTGYSQDVMSFTVLFAEDSEFQEDEISWRRRQPSFDVWRLFAENLNAKASAADYGQLLKMVISDQVGTPYVNFLVRRVLEWPMELAINQEQFALLGQKGGSLPGILTTAYYGQRLEDGRQVVVVIFFRDLPRETYQRWQKDLSHDALARWLLSDPKAISIMRTLIQP
jgi:D-alanyl-D-alanine carboxypeptidase